MNSEEINNFMNTFGDIHKKYFIHKNIIYLKKEDDIIRDKFLNTNLDKKDLEKLLNKLNIKSTIKSIKLGEFKTISDTILGDKYNPIGYELLITMDDNIFYKFQRCVDDYKYINDIIKVESILIEDMKKKENMYIKLLVNSYLLFVRNNSLKISKLFTPNYFSSNITNLQTPISVYGGNNANPLFVKRNK